MAYYYVKSGFGTSTSVASSTTKRTGAFASMSASDTYASFAAVFAYNAVVAGDVICFSNSHTDTGSLMTLDNPGSLGTVLCVSVDDSNCDTASPGATWNSATYIHFQSNRPTLLFDGWTMKWKDYFSYYVAFSHITFRNCTIGPDSATDTGDYIFSAWTNTTKYILEDTDVYTHDVNGALGFYFDANTEIYWYGGTLLAGATYPLAYLFKSNSSGAWTAELSGVDLSNHAGLTLVAMAGAETTQLGPRLRLNNCKMPASWSYSSANFLNPRGFIEIVNSDNSVEYFMARKDYYGLSETQATYARSGGSEIDSTPIAYEVVTSSAAKEGIAGHRLYLASVKADFSTAKTIKVFMQYSNGSAVDLTTEDIGIAVAVPQTDMTVKWYFSYGTEFDGGGATDYANNSETWSGSLANAVKQEMSVTTDGSEGTGFADIYVVQFKPSETVYVCLEPSVT